MSFEEAYGNYLFYASNRHKKQGFDTITKNFKLHINHSIHRKGNRDLDTPKNLSSIRTIKVDFLTLIRFYILKKMYFKKYGYGIDYFIFGGIKPLSPTTIDRYKIKACKTSNLIPITQHEFRHSYATRMIHKKVPIDIVSKNMGHSTVSMTVDVYLH